MYPILPVHLPGEGGAWAPQSHYYFMVRFVRRSGGQITSESPAQMVGFTAQQITEPPLDYLHSICSPQGDPPPRFFLAELVRQVDLYWLAHTPTVEAGRRLFKRD